MKNRVLVYSGLFLCCLTIIGTLIIGGAGAGSSQKMTNPERIGLINSRYINFENSSHDGIILQSKFVSNELISPFMEDEELKLAINSVPYYVKWARGERMKFIPVNQLSLSNSDLNLRLDMNVKKRIGMLKSVFNYVREIQSSPIPLSSSKYAYTEEREGDQLIIHSTSKKNGRILSSIIDKSGHIDELNLREENGSPIRFKKMKFENFSGRYRVSEVKATNHTKGNYEEIDLVVSYFKEYPEIPSGIVFRSEGKNGRQFTEEISFTLESVK